jgi:hypothetical protein
LPPPDQGLGAVLPGLGDGTPPHTVAPTPPPALATPAGPGAVLAQAGALRHGLAQPPAAPQPQALGVAPLSRQQRRALARQQAKALKREAATARLARWG